MTLRSRSSQGQRSYCGWTDFHQIWSGTLLEHGKVFYDLDYIFSYWPWGQGHPQGHLQGQRSITEQSDRRLGTRLNGLPSCYLLFLLYFSAPFWCLLWDDGRLLSKTWESNCEISSPSGWYCSVSYYPTFHNTRLSPTHLLESGGLFGGKKFCDKHEEHGAWPSW